MNPLTLVKRIQQINAKEAALGISEDASWHAKYKESAYVFVGGLPLSSPKAISSLFSLMQEMMNLDRNCITWNFGFHRYLYDFELDIVASLLEKLTRYGEIVDINLVRDKATGKSKGFAFIAYEDQRSTNLAVDNLNGANVYSRILRVDHVTKYKKKEVEDEEELQKKREARGVCRAFQKGECNRGDACKFSHNEERCANTGWVPKDASSRWENDKYDDDQPRNRPKIPRVEKPHGTTKQPGSYEKESTYRDLDTQAPDNRSGNRDPEHIPREDHDRRGREDMSRRYELGSNLREGSVRRGSERGRKYDRDSFSRQHREEDDSEPNPKDDHDNRRKERSRGQDLESNPREDGHRRARDDRSQINARDDRSSRGEKQSRYDNESSSRRCREEDEVLGGRELKPNPREDRDRRIKDDRSEINAREDRERRTRDDRSETDAREDPESRGGEKRSSYDNGSSSRKRKEEDEVADMRLRR
ncbi:hypothetical protein GIB67_036785 [Kingdonia uniflora]|uniref:Uncharacterized protein n=1 Tax=Kingdonia uniflora TaxID=39325 RepID=A0A7J7LWN8_9MAGN|nr:hypothetical protein GIB67_036785 [Kingdonia uniflora]